MIETVTIPRASLRLVTNEGYFTRYREHRAAGHSCRVAWAKTENELRQGLPLSRFNSYPSFVEGLRYEKKKTRTQRVMFTIIEPAP
jgi:hypothetical protein